MASQIPKTTQKVVDPNGQMDRNWRLYLTQLQASGGTAIPFRSLPANPQVGAFAVINDSATTTWGATVTSTSPAPGATVLAWFNSAGNWSVIGI
jgi:hypothetical protein